MPTTDQNKGDSGNGGSDLVGDVTKVADSKLMVCLFGASATLFGKYLEGRTKNFISWLESESQRSQEGNVENHVSNVVEVTGQSLRIQPAQIVKLERWVRIAAEIPVEDLERSAVVEAALEELASTMGSPAFEEAAEKLTSESARLLLDAPQNLTVGPKGIDRRGFEHLRSLGLASTPNRLDVIVQIAAWLIGTLFGLFLLCGVIRLIAAWYPLLFLGFLGTEFIVDSIVISAVAVGLGILAVSTRYRLTEYGKSLQKAARRFYRQPSRRQKTRVPSALLSRPFLLWAASAALLVCLLPFALQAYLPTLMRFTAPRTVIVTAPPANPASPAQPAPSPAPSTPASKSMTLTADQVKALVDVWGSVKDQMDDIVGLTKAGQALLPNWPQRVREGGSQAFANELVRQRNLINQRRISLQPLFTAYQRYPNVSSALAQVASTGVFDRLYRDQDSFSHEVQNLPAPLPENFENTLRPYASELKDALDAMAQWADSTRNFAKIQSDELSKAQ